MYSRRNYLNFISDFIKIPSMLKVWADEDQKAEQKPKWLIETYFPIYCGINEPLEVECKMLMRLDFVKNPILEKKYKVNKTKNNYSKDTKSSGQRREGRIYRNSVMKIFDMRADDSELNDILLRRCLYMEGSDKVIDAGKDFEESLKNA